MCFQREVASIEETDGGIWNVAFEGIGACWQKEWIVLAPHRKKRRLVLAEIKLEGRIERDIAFVVAKQIQLDLIGADVMTIPKARAMTTNLTISSRNSHRETRQ